VAFDVGRLDKGAAVADLVYVGPPGSGAGDTALLAAARARGLRTVDGLDVLVHQAIASLEIWMGRPRLDSLAAPLREAAAAPFPAEPP
jgi:shikimate dehydrogenase